MPDRSLASVFLTGTKAAVSALSSLYGSSTVGAHRVPSAMLGLLHEPYAGAWQRGAHVEEMGALTAFSAVHASVGLIASDIAKLALLIKRQHRDGTWEEDIHWGLNLLRKPNAYSTRGQFFERWLASKLLHGNTYVLKVRGANGIEALHVLDPRRVTPMVTPEGDVYYSLAGDDLSRIPAGQVVPASEIIHDRCVALWHPLVGVSPINACGISATQGLRIQSNSAQFFHNMSRPSGMLTAPGLIGDDTARRLKAHWEQSYSGQNIGKLAVLGDGLKYEPMTIPAVDAQLIEQLRWTVEDVARAFRVPLYMLQAGAAPNLTNVEALQQSYYSQTLQSHIEAIEQCLDAGLGLRPDTRTEFDLRGMLRMDTASRYAALGEGVRGGWLAPNEARAMEDLPPVEGGASPLAQQQNYSLAALAKRDARPDPFGSEVSEAALTDYVARALDELIEHMQPEMRSAFLRAKDTRWVTKYVTGERSL